MADAVTQFSTLSSDAPNVYIAREMYRLSENKLRVGKFAKMHQVPQRMGTTLRVVRYKRLNLPTSTLTEGTPPDAVALATENVDVTLEQWGIVVLLTDVAEITTTHPALQIAIDRTSLAIAEVLEREMCETLMGGTQVRYATGVANRAALDGTKKITTADILAMTVSLRNSGAAENEGGLYDGVLPPQLEGDVLGADTTFQSASNFANVRRLDFGEIGVWMGVRWARGNFMPILAGIAAPGTQTASVSGFAESGAGGAFGAANIIVVSKDATSGYERKISQTKTTAAGSDDATITTPTSTNYVYDIYSDGDAGSGTYKLMFGNVAANTAKVLTQTVYTAASAATPPSAPASGKEVFVAWIFGKDSFGRVELNGMSLASYITPPGASYSNPLAQGRKVGTKIMWKSFIIDNNFFYRLESNSTYSAGLPA